MWTLQQIGRVTITGLALCAFGAACVSKVKQQRSGTGGQMTPYNIPGYPVQWCASPPQPSRIIRVKLHDNLGDLASETKRRVRYETADNTTLGDDDVNQYSNTAYSNEDVISANFPYANLPIVNDADGSNGTNAAAPVSASSNTDILPYDIDVTTMGIQSGDNWVEIRFIIGSGSKDMFYVDKKPTYGITFEDNLPPDYVCVAGVNVDKKQGGKILDLFLSEKPGGAATLHPFNVVLVAKSGPRTTPISIDPKLLNNG